MIYDKIPTVFPKVVKDDSQSGDKTMQEPDEKPCDEQEVIFRDRRTRFNDALEAISRPLDDERRRVDSYFSSLPWYLQVNYVRSESG